MSSLVALPVLVAAPSASATTAPGGHDAQMVIDWQRIAIRTIYTENLNPPPVGALYLGFTALAVKDAVQDARGRGHTSVDAAAATAAHDVLAEYFPSSLANLDADLVTSLAAVPDGRAEDKGVRVGQAAADEMIASRVGDGRNDASIVYTVPTPVPPGVWAPPATGMLAPWLGFVDHLVVHGSVPVRGPLALDSARYASDFNEVKDVGGATSLVRTQAQTDTALFFTANPVAQLNLALCAYLEANPIGIARTARLFANTEATIADSLIQAWRAKYEDRVWRPSQAIVRAAEDGNAATTADPTWAPLVPNPPYSDSFSGHGSVTGSFAASVRLYLGDATPLTLTSGANPARTYSTLSALEADAFMARIWSGLHFRQAMLDAYRVGHVNAHRVAWQLR